MVEDGLRRREMAWIGTLTPSSWWIDPMGAILLSVLISFLWLRTAYQEFQLLNNEFAFDVDVSQLPCGLNGALYFSEMASDGGASQFPTNKAGAKYGTGYCDSQCPRDLKFIDGQVSILQCLAF